MTEQTFNTMKRKKVKAMSQSITAAQRPTLGLNKPLFPATPKQDETKKSEVTEVKISKIPEELQADPLLVKILSTCRAHGSTGDQEFRLWLFNYINSTLKLKPIIKVEGNIYVETDPKSTVLFSCHVDTVHRNDEKGPQQLAFDPAFGHLFLADKKVNSCLGGDDGVGVYIMLKMLAAGVKGKYMFHTGEERGGIGSNAFVRANQAFCEDLELVVAFDRAVRSGENPEVIATQGGKSCASVEFSKALCDQLNTHGDFDLPYIVSHKGSFTDSKVYSSIVPECVNVGCFYERQHTSEEYVDIVGVEKLVAAAIKTTWSMLPIIRKIQPDKPTPYSGAYANFGGGMDFGRDTSDSLWGDMPSKANALKAAPKAKPEMPQLSMLDELKIMSKSDLEVMLLDDPDAAVEIIVELMLENAGLRGQYDALRNLVG